MGARGGITSNGLNRQGVSMGFRAPSGGERMSGAGAISSILGPQKEKMQGSKGHFRRRRARLGAQRRKKATPRTNYTNSVRKGRNRMGMF